MTNNIVLISWVKAWFSSCVLFIELLCVYSGISVSCSILLEAECEFLEELLEVSGHNDICAVA